MSSTRTNHPPCFLLNFLILILNFILLFLRNNPLRDSCFFTSTCTTEVKKNGGHLQDKSNSPLLFYPKDEAGAFYKRILGTVKASNMDVITISKNPSGFVQAKPSFFMCNAPKTGCTDWKYFWAYVNKGVRWESSNIEQNPGIIHQYNQQQKLWFHNRSNSEIVRMGTQLERFAIGRNPYARFLSSYLDWIYARTPKEITEKEIPFEKFTSEFYDVINGKNISETFFKDTITMNHIEPISKFCNIGLFNYTVLRVEDQALWFNQFLIDYDLKSTMDAYTSFGNKVYTSSLQKGSTIEDFTSQILGKETWPSAFFNSSHHRGSLNKIGPYYTPAIAKQVTDIAFVDLMNFGYPLWDGNFENFHLV